MEVPDVYYARSGDVAVAYQVVGEGPEDLVFLPFLSNLYTLWQFPRFAAFGRRLSAGRRLVVVNPRGVGLSDRPRGFTIDSRIDDLLAVMDAVGCERPALFGVAEAAATCAVLAATHPDRVARLVLATPLRRGVEGEDARAAALMRIREERLRFGERSFLQEFARQLNPQWADDPTYLDWFVWHTRVTASPAAFAEFRRMQLDLDVSDVLPAIRMPVLVLSKDMAAGDARDVAERIPGAQLVHIPGEGVAIHENDLAADAIDAFLAGASDSAVPDTVLATLLFTDLVGSTEQAARLGDRRWRELLDEHRRLVRRELARYRGAELDTAGDGFFASFDGPARAIMCAHRIVDATSSSLGVAVRAGIHTGECERSDGKLAGLAVHVAARVVSAAGPGEVLVTGTVRDLVAGSGIRFEDRGARELRGVPGSWPLWEVVADR